jgi:hypothetical protein
VALAGSFLALFGVFASSLSTAISQRSHWRFTEQGQACSNFLGEYSKIYLSYSKAVNSERSERFTATTEFVDWAPFNQAQEVLNLMASHQIVEAAHALDRVLWEVGLRITRIGASKGDWAELRKPLDDAKLQFVNVTRTTLGREREPLRALSGRPSDDDPIWRIQP